MVRSRCCACVLGTCRVSYCACSRLTDVAAPSPDARRDLSHNVGTLLDELEIPRAISAPPQLDDRWALGLVRRIGELCGVAALRGCLFGSGLAAAPAWTLRSA